MLFMGIILVDVLLGAGYGFRLSPMPWPHEASLSFNAAHGGRKNVLPGMCEEGAREYPFILNSNDTLNG